jgi:hypothetical protein
LQNIPQLLGQDQGIGTKEKFNAQRWRVRCLHRRNFKINDCTRTFSAVIAQLSKKYRRWRPDILLQNTPIKRAPALKAKK